MSETDSAFISASAAVVQALAALGALWFVVRQLRQASVQIGQATQQVILAAQAHQLTGFMAVVSLEVALGEARGALTDACVALMAARERKASNEMILVLEAAVAARQQQYDNLLDRLCSAIVHGLIDEATYRPDYRDVIKSASERTNHIYIQEVHNAWRIDRPAVRKRT